MALDNAGYLPDGTQYQEFLYAGISREYNRFIRGTQPLQMEVADYWASGATSQRERNLVHFLRWRSAQGRPLHVSTVERVEGTHPGGPAVREDWRVFARDAYRGLEPAVHGRPAARLRQHQPGRERQLSVRPFARRSGRRFGPCSQTHNSGFLQPRQPHPSRRIGLRRVPRYQSRFLVADLHWHGSGGHSQTTRRGLGRQRLGLTPRRSFRS